MCTPGLFTYNLSARPLPYFPENKTECYMNLCSKRRIRASFQGSLGHCHSHGLCPKESELVFPSQGFYPNHLRAEGGQRWNSHQFKDSRREGRGVAPRCQSPGTKLPLQVLISEFFLLCGNPHSGEGWKRPRVKLHKKK